MRRRGLRTTTATSRSRNIQKLRQMANSEYNTRIITAVKLVSTRWMAYGPRMGIYEINIVADLLKAFLRNGSVNTVNVQQWKMCLSGRMLLRAARQQRTN
jgi:fumarate hydratase class II